MPPRIEPVRTSRRATPTPLATTLALGLALALVLVLPASLGAAPLWSRTHGGLDDEAPIAVGGHEGLAALQIALAAIESVETGQAVILESLTPE